MTPSDINGPLTLTVLSHVAARTTTVTQNPATDVREYKGGLVVIQSVGTVGGDTRTLNGKIQQSPTGSGDWEDIPGAVFAEVSAADNVQKIGFDVRMTKGFIRYVGTIAGTGTPSLTMGVVLLGQKERV